MRSLLPQSLLFLGLRLGLQEGLPDNGADHRSPQSTEGPQV